MPQLGEIKRARDIDNFTNKGYQKHIWVACVDCGKERWGLLSSVSLKKPRHPRCKVCSDKIRGQTFSKKYKGIRLSDRKQVYGIGQYDKAGYFLINLSPDDFFFPMANGKGQVREHRLVMAKSLGRCLHRWELVHHKNGIKDDNRIENLQLVSDDRHKQITILEQRIVFLEKRVTLLEAENELLNQPARQRR